MKIADLKNKLDTLKNSTSKLEGQVNLLSSQINDVEDKLQLANNNKVMYVKEVEILQFIQQQKQETIKNSIESVVMYALRYIFNEDYKFKLEFDRRGNLGELYFMIKPPDCEDYIQLQPFGNSGGVLDVVSLALKLVSLQLVKPHNPGFVILDEPFKHLHHVPIQRVINAKNFVHTIAQKINRQVVMVTGSPIYCENVENVFWLSPKEVQDVE